MKPAARVGRQRSVRARSPHWRHPRSLAVPADTDACAAAAPTTLRAHLPGATDSDAPGGRRDGTGGGARPWHTAARATHRPMLSFYDGKRRAGGGGVHTNSADDLCLRSPAEVHGPPGAGSRRVDLAPAIEEQGPCRVAAAPTSRHSEMSSHTDHYQLDAGGSDSRRSLDMTLGSRGSHSDAIRSPSESVTADQHIRSPPIQTAETGPSITPHQFFRLWQLDNTALAPLSATCSGKCV